MHRTFKLPAQDTMSTVHDWAVAVEYNSPPQTSFSYCATDYNQSSEASESFVQRGAPLSSGKLRNITNDLEHNYAVG